MTVDKKDYATALVTMTAAMVRGTTRRHSPGAPGTLLAPTSPDTGYDRYRLVHRPALHMTPFVALSGTVITKCKNSSK